MIRTDFKQLIDSIRPKSNRNNFHTHTHTYIYTHTHIITISIAYEIESSTGSTDVHESVLIPSLLSEQGAKLSNRYTNSFKKPDSNNSK